MFARTSGPILCNDRTSAVMDGDFMNHEVPPLLSLCNLHPNTG